MRYIFLVLLLPVLVLTACIAAPEKAGTSAKFIETGFTTAAGEKHTIAVPLKAGQTVEGSFGVSGTDHSIDFYVTGPDRQLVSGVVRAVGSQSFEVKAETAGTYTLYFDNSISFGNPRQISLRYRTR